jgi:hypothetical protein
MIQGIVAQEMLHIGLARKMYTATGGSLQGRIATSCQPIRLKGLPGGVYPDLVVSLVPFGNELLQTFMQYQLCDCTGI